MADYAFQQAMLQEMDDHLKSKEKTNFMKTSKVQRVMGTKPWGEGERRTIYHNLEMENGDKINIGKKKELAIGDEITYQLVGGDDQQEYKKAKSVNPDYNAGNKGGFKDQDSILYQVALKGVMDYYISQSDPQFKPVFTSDSINALALDIAKQAKINIKILKNEG